MNDEIIKNGEQSEDDDIIQLINEDGETVDFYHVGTIQYKDEWYVFFQPTEEFAEDYDEDYGDLVVFKLETDEKGEDIFTPVLDEAVREAVYEEYAKLIGEDGCDCGCEGEHDSCDCNGCGDDHDDCEDSSCDCGKCDCSDHK